MKTRTFGWTAGLSAALLVGSMAFAQTADDNGAGATPPAGQQQTTDQSADKDTQSSGTTTHHATNAATPSPNASPKALQTPSRTGAKAKHHRRKMKIKLGHYRSAPKNASSTAQHSTTASGSNSGSTSGTKTGATSGTGSTAGTGQASGGGGTTGAGSQTGSGNASQGNLPNQQGNQTDNQQNNSQNNKNVNTSVGTILTGLVNVNAQNINVNVYKVIDIHNVLNNSQVEILTQKIQNSPGAKASQNVLTNLFRGAHVLNGNQVILGLLSQQHLALAGPKPGATTSSSTTK